MNKIINNSELLDFLTVKTVEKERRKHSEPHISLSEISVIYSVIVKMISYPHNWLMRDYI